MKAKTVYLQLHSYGVVTQVKVGDTLARVDTKDASPLVAHDCLIKSRAGVLSRFTFNEK